MQRNYITIHLNSYSVPLPLAGDCGRYARSYCIIAYGGELVTRIEEIKNAVVSLPVNEYRKLRDWFLERDWEEWDKQIEADSQSGKLDFIVKEAMNEKSRGKLREL